MDEVRNSSNSENRTGVVRRQLNQQRGGILHIITYGNIIIMALQPFDEPWQLSVS
jgi:hypothetical protein